MTKKDIKTSVNCYVNVTGQPTDDDDEFVVGCYLIAVTLEGSFDQSQLTPQIQSDVAQISKDSFHEHQGISNLEDFEIVLYLESGESIDEDDDLPESDVVMSADHCGRVNDGDVPPEVRKSIEESAERIRAANRPLGA